MNNSEIKTALFTIFIFALGAVGLILAQHSIHTGQILSALAPSSNGSCEPANDNATSVASLGGTATPFEAGTDIPPASVAPLQANAGWAIG